MAPKTKAQEFRILTSPLWTPFLWPLGVTQRQAYAQLHEGKLHVHFGRVFDAEFPLDEVEGAELARWPLWAGIGPRTDFRGNVGLIGTYVNVVEVRFKEPQRVRLLFPVTCRKLYVSMEEPHAFIEALRRQKGGEQPGEPARAA